MACKSATLAGLVKDCSANIGGIIEVAIVHKADISEITEDAGKIKTITLKDTANFKRYQFNRGTGSMTSTYTIDNANGIRFVTTQLVLQFSRMETTKRVEISALAQDDFVAICKDANGVYWFLGKDEAVRLSAGDGQTGTARTDANRYSITLEDVSKDLPFEVEASIVEALID